MSASAPPLVLNDVGITVPDIFAAIDWYGEVFGCTLIMGPRLMSAEGKATAETRQVFGPGFNRMLQAHLLTGMIGVSGRAKTSVGCDGQHDLALNATLGSALVRLCRLGTRK